MNVIQSLAYPSEFLAILKFKLFGCKALAPKGKLKARADLSYRRCYELLNLTSRSFAAVIQALDDELRHAVCIFYLVLRALDTVEDDMTIPVDEKTSMLKAFHTCLHDPHWKYMHSKEKDRMVLEEFQLISREFRGLKREYQAVIGDICARMGAGMCEYLTRCPDSLQDWDQYCYYVAGLVGIGLSRLFSASQLETFELGKEETISNSMGLFLQKTNIIRDYLEDALEGRHFWPKQVWGKYSTDLLALRHFALNERLACLNELILNALDHIPDCIDYLSNLQNPSVFNFCAIPQVMAIATLERCFNNKSVYERNVKIRKGEAVKLMTDSDNIHKVKDIFTHFLLRMKARIPCDSNRKALTAAIDEGLRVCTRDTATADAVTVTPTRTVYVTVAILAVTLLWNIGIKRLHLHCLRLQNISSNK